MSSVKGDFLSFDDEIIAAESASVSSTKEERIERWRASEPPEELFTEAEQDAEWQYDIIGEEVDENGNLFFEVRWDDWARSDGTKTTWNTPDSINSFHWRKRQSNLRAGQAKKALDINIISTTDIHNTETYLRSQAYHEKLRKSTAKERNLMVELTRLQAKHQGHADGPAMLSHAQGSSVSSHPLRNNQRASTRQKTELSLGANSSSSSLRGSGKPSTPSLNSPRLSSPSFIMSSASSSASTFSQRSLSHKESDFSPLSSSGTKNVQRNYPTVLKWRIKRTLKSDTEDELQTPPAHYKSDVVPAKRPKLANEVSAQEALRSELQSSWTKIAAREKAAPIYISNTVDNVAIPDLSTDFRYLENSYEFTASVPDPTQMENFLLTCNSSHCRNADNCECQQVSTLVDETGSPVLAYTAEGYFAFNVPKGTEVVECNKLCKCSVNTCQNRVSQHPRDVPIEIFKTETRGWGVKPSINLKRGKVLGLYTGLVVPRAFTRTHPKHANSQYVFDLDGDEVEADVATHHELFSVDSELAGNWTRFINHSCSPNLQVYLVVHDIPPDVGLPFIAFVAKEDISAGTELTFDYNPREAERLEANHKKKKRGRKKKNVSSSAGSVSVSENREGSRPCKCGSKSCRGFLL